MSPIDINTFIFLQVSTIGLISLRNPFNWFFGEQFDDPIIAPLWGDFVNLEQLGSNVFSRVTNSQETLEMVATQLRTVNQDFTDYNPTLAVIVTWDRIRDYNTKSSVVC